MNLVLLAKLAAWLLIVFVFAFVYGQRRGDALGRGFLMFAAVSGVWIFLELLLYIPALVGAREVIHRIIGLIWVPVGFLFLNFAYPLVDRRPDAPYYLLLVLSLAGALVTPFTDLVYMGWHESRFEVIDERDPIWHSLLALIPTAASLLGLWLVLLRRLGTTDPRGRGPLTLVLLGGVLTLASAVVMNVVLPNLLGVPEFPRLGSAATAVFVFLIYLAVRRYDFLAITVEGT
ncbi:MAG: hypothetical protein JRI55_12920, partial [Deltaproteobacteria bacterium]|nr:hypothetical protein [Deltaproteobacteria bacterium]